MNGMNKNHKTPFEASFIAQTLWADLSPIDWLVCACWKKNLMMHPAAWLVPCNIANLAGIWNENLSLNDDGEYFCRIILASKGVKFCTVAKSYYRSGNLTSLSSLKSYEGFKSAFSSVELCSNNLLAHENSSYTRYAAACAWQYFVFMAYPQAKDLVKYAEKNIRLLGGCDLSPDGGFMFRIICEIFGWKNAKRLQTLLFKKGHYKIVLSRLFNSLN